MPFDVNLDDIDPVSAKLNIIQPQSLNLASSNLVYMGILAPVFPCLSLQ